MAGESWVDRSLRRSAKLGHEVLEKAKQRSANSQRDKPPPVFSHSRRDRELDQAFTVLVECMAETTRQCKKYYKSVPPTERREREHICRFHSQKMLRTSQKRTTSVDNKPDTGSTGSEDFLIEVAPGTYSITAAMRDTNTQTRTVHVAAGESRSLTFNL